MSRQSIMDMDLSGRIKEIQSAEGRQKAPIEIAGPAGNPTQPTGQPGTPKPFLAASCPSCKGMRCHAPGCTLAGSLADPEVDGWLDNVDRFLNPLISRQG